MTKFKFESNNTKTSTFVFIRETDEYIGEIWRESRGWVNGANSRVFTTRQAAAENLNNGGK